MTNDTLTLERFWLHPDRHRGSGARVQLSDGSQVCVRAQPGCFDSEFRPTVCECLIDDAAPWLGDVIERQDTSHPLFAGWDKDRADAERKAWDATEGKAA
jgi:hypothetical protein